MNCGELSCLNQAGQCFLDIIPIAYGKLYASGYDGYVRAYDITSGNQVWEYFYGSAGYETPYGTWPTYAGFNIADGKIYVTNDDHSPDSVIWRGGKLHVINAQHRGRSMEHIRMDAPWCYF